MSSRQKQTSEKKYDHIEIPTLEHRNQAKWVRLSGGRRDRKFVVGDVKGREKLLPVMRYLG
jgi:hypothetical protein